MLLEAIIILNPSSVKDVVWVRVLNMWCGAAPPLNNLNSEPYTMYVVLLRLCLIARNFLENILKLKQPPYVALVNSYLKLRHT